MQSSQHTYDRHDLVVKKEGWANVLFGLPGLALFTICLFFGIGTKNYFKEHTWATIFSILAIGTAAYFLIRNGFDNRIKLVISKDGIWTVKQGLINWSDIQYYYFEERSDGESTASSLKIKLVNIDRTIDINTSMLNTNEEEIEKAITCNSGDFNIIQLLKEIRVY
ncbi:hypothetical protein ACKFKF_32815 [Phormidesmis sp. 146-12]